MLILPLVAHEQAFEVVHTLHRDVSAGNILILPDIIFLGDIKESYAVGLKGLLSDWELAKISPETDEALFASQPERTVCFTLLFVIIGD